MADQYDEHYLRDVTALGDTREVVTSQAIWSNSRTKLIEKGVRVDSRLHARLMQHKLASPIEECLAIADQLTARAQRAEAEKLLESDSGYRLLCATEARPRELLAAIEHAPLDDVLAVRLTVMKERRPAMYTHAVGVALLTTYMARSSGITGEPLASHAAAGLYHDLGEMHIDPDLLAVGRRLTDAERRHIYAHPLTAYLMLQARPSCAGLVADMVFEHHERIDGSGYPRGIRGDELSKSGRILSIAELAANFFASPVEAGALARLQMALKFNYRRFDRAVSNLISGLAATAAPVSPEGSIDLNAVIEKIGAIQQIFKSWSAFSSVPAAPTALRQWMTERLEHLERLLIEAGLDPGQGTQFIELIAEDPVTRAELPAATRELTWLLTEVIQDFYRRPDAVADGPLKDWVDQTRTALGTARA